MQCQTRCKLYCLYFLALWLAFWFIKRIYLTLLHDTLFVYRKCLKQFEIMKIKNALTVSYNFSIQGIVTEYVRESFLTWNTCATVPLIRVCVWGTAGRLAQSLIIIITTKVYDTGCSPCARITSPVLYRLSKTGGRMYYFFVMSFWTKKT